MCWVALFFLHVITSVWGMEEKKEQPKLSTQLSKMSLEEFTQGSCESPRKQSGDSVSTQTSEGVWCQEFDEPDSSWPQGIQEKWQRIMNFLKDKDVVLTRVNQQEDWEIQQKEKVFGTFHLKGIDPSKRKCSKSKQQEN